VGEPWSSVAVEAGVGAIVASSTAIWPRSPEKVLGCREEWADRRPTELAALLRALHRAALWCERAENHEPLARLLAEPRYVGTAAELLHRGLSGRLVLAPGAQPAPAQELFIPWRHAATFPWVSHALWFYTQMVRWRQIDPAPEHLPQVRGSYRPDLYRAALAPIGVEPPRGDAKVETFFDDRVFDPADLTGYASRARP
jgi:ABC-type nitrate/sulfonate/bicarbonate transport system substrate-binding protein